MSTDSPRSDAHLGVLIACVLGCLAVGLWPRRAPEPPVVEPDPTTAAAADALGEPPWNRLVERTPEVR